MAQIAPNQTDVPGQGEDGSHALAIRRHGNAVHVVLTCADDYAAIKLYDQLVKSAESGQFQLGVAARRR